MSSKKKTNSNDLEVLKAASTLSRMKNTTLNEQEMTTLHQLKASSSRNSVRIPAQRATLYQLKASSSRNSVRRPAHIITQNSSMNSILDDKSPNFPPVVEKLRREIRSCSKLIKKTLTNTDLDVKQCRLLLITRDVSEILKPLLKEGEDQILKEGIPVTTYNLKGNEYPMSLKFWANKSYVLTTGWNKFHQENRLKIRHHLTLWMFRHATTRKLCFVIS